MLTKYVYGNEFTSAEFTHLKKGIYYMTASYEFDSNVEDDFVVRAYSAGNVEFSSIDSDVIT